MSHPASASKYSEDTWIGSLRHVLWVAIVSLLGLGPNGSCLGLASGKCLRSLKGHTAAVYAVCSVIGGRVVTCSRDDTVRVWDVASGRCLQTLEGHVYGVLTVCDLGGGRVITG